MSGTLPRGKGGTSRGTEAGGGGETRPESVRIVLEAPPHLGVERLRRAVERRAADRASGFDLSQVESSMPENVTGRWVHVALFPSERAYRKRLRKKFWIDREKALSAWCAFSESLDRFDVVLCEDESFRKTLETLLRKLKLFRRLRRGKRTGAEPGLPESPACFIVWGHGLPSMPEIEACVAESFEILFVRRMPIRDLDRLIEEVYAEEILTKGRHILGKNRHLSKQPRELAVLLVRERPDKTTFVCKGHGPHLRICGSMEEHVKQTIRDRLNPRRPDGERTEEHVIHGTHDASQIAHILEVLGLGWLPEGARKT